MSSQLGDMFGRKTTLFISLAGSAIGLFTFTIYSYLRQNGSDTSDYLWLPLVSLPFIIFISSAEIVALANTRTVENFPPKVGSLMLIVFGLEFFLIGVYIRAESLSKTQKVLKCIESIENAQFRPFSVLSIKQFHFSTSHCIQCLSVILTQYPLKLWFTPYVLAFSEDFTIFQVCNSFK